MTLPSTSGQDLEPPDRCARAGERSERGNRRQQSRRHPVHEHGDRVVCAAAQRHRGDERTDEEHRQPLGHPLHRQYAPVVERDASESGDHRSGRDQMRDAHSATTIAAE
jgi:hypothetical protein